MYNILGLVLAGGMMAACSDEEVWEGGSTSVDENLPVTVSLAVKDVTPTQVKTRATEAEETLLNNLQVFIFDAGNGKLKGYTKIEGSENLAQGGEKGTVSVKTRTGNSYIYAIANHTTSVYKADLTAFPDNLNAENAQSGDVSFTIDDFKALAFNREAGEINIAEAGFLMSGSANDGQSCTIARNNDGTAYISNPTTDDGKIIKLKRVVSKVQFNIAAANGKTFTPTTYDIMNVPLKGNLVSGQALEGVTYENLTGFTFNPNTPNSFEVYLPENLQAAKKNAAKWDDRETNTYSEGTKSFDNAPDKGTYVVVYGIYEDKNGKLEGDVHYTVHLGNFNTAAQGSLDNYNNERNFRYEYSIEVQSVDKIIAEATINEETEWQPGAEGFVINYNSGESFRVDSHYESVVMRFTYDEISKLKGTQAGTTSKGYTYQVKTHQGVVTEMITNQTEFAPMPNGVDVSWIEFYKGVKNNGDPLNYTEAKGKSKYGVRELLAYLYDIADADDKIQWTNGEYLDFTCFISENYYDYLSWDTYVNIEPRSFCIANHVYESTDKMSVYADVKYNVSQHAIQTFYDRSKSGTIVAYGCETINDEQVDLINGKERGTTMTVTNEVGSSQSETGENGYTWHGRGLTKKDMNWKANQTWPYESSLEAFHMACMARNRDLNQDGKIADDEIRWYTPSLPQMTGLWIGEEAIATDARLYNKSMEGVIFREPKITHNNYNVLKVEDGTLQNHMHYYTSTNPQRVFWAEEGMAYGAVSDNETIDYIRCVRTLKSGTAEVKQSGVVDIPDMYYSYTDGVFNLSNVDSRALRTSTITNGELNAHKERPDGTETDNLNKTKNTFEISTKGVTSDKAAKGQPSTRVDNQDYSYFNLETIRTATGSASPCYHYVEGNEPKGSWRIPNQREFALMILERTLSSDSRPHYASRTGYSGNHRFGYRFASNNLAMIEPDKLSYPNPWFENYRGFNQFNGNNGIEDRYRIRCVRDK